ncbi:MAG: hypothetical protein VW268_13635 [Rhodospirillaceae bacterium]
MIKGDQKVMKLQENWKTAAFPPAPTAPAEAVEAAPDTGAEKLTDRLKSMLELTERLTDLTESENLALAERRVRDIEDMLEEKATLSRLYENGMKSLGELKIDWSKADLDVREKLRLAAERLTKAVDENTMRLEIGMTVNKHVIDQISDVVKGAVPHSGTYSRSGKKGTEGAKASANSVSVALDQTL